jgi:hypothetical protein
LLGGASSFADKWSSYQLKGAFGGGTTPFTTEGAAGFY